MFPECSQSFESDSHVEDDRGVSFGLEETEDVFRDMRLEIVRKSVFEDVFVGRALNFLRKSKAAFPSVIHEWIFLV